MAAYAGRERLLPDASPACLPRCCAVFSSQCKVSASSACPAPPANSPPPPSQLPSLHSCRPSGRPATTSPAWWPPAWWAWSASTSSPAWSTRESGVQLAPRRLDLHRTAAELLGSGVGNFTRFCLLTSAPQQQSAANSLLTPPWPVPLAAVWTTCPCSTSCLSCWAWACPPGSPTGEQDCRAKCCTGVQMPACRLLHAGHSRALAHRVL